MSLKSVHVLRWNKLLLIPLLLAGLLVWLLWPQSSVVAGWFDDNWLYRVAISIGNTGSADANKKVKFDIDTATLITAGKMQSDCGDSRFTDAGGKILKYYLDGAGGACNGASTDYYVLMESIPVGGSIIYHYYGNSSAPNGTQSSQFSESTFAPNSGPTAASEEKSPGPVASWSFDEGTGTTTYDATENNNDGTLTNGPVWKNESDCISGKCLQFDGSDDVATVTDATSLDLTNTGTIQAWIKPNDTSSSESNFASWTSITAPDGTDFSDHSQVDATIVGNKLYFAAYMNNQGTDIFQTANSDLDGTNMTSWTTQTAPGGAGQEETTSVAIGSDGLKLYYAAMSHNEAVESFFTATSDLDGSNFSAWTNQPDPDGAAGNDSTGSIDMVIVGNKMYLASYQHNIATETFQIAYADLDGGNFVGWTTPSVTAPNGADVDNGTSIALTSDGQKLYYAALTTDDTVESFYTTTSDLDGTDFIAWTSRTAPNGNGTLQSISHIDMTIVGNKLYIAAYLHDQGTEAFSTANMDLDGSNMTSWTAHNTGLDGASLLGDAVPTINTDGKKLYYTAFAFTDETESLYITSSDIPSHPVISKSGAYELIQTGGGFVFDWGGPPISFGNIAANTWNHVAVTHTGAEMIYYLNAREVRRQTTTVDFSSNANNLLIGSNGTNLFKGFIDEVRIYPYARTADAIKTDFTSRGTMQGVGAQFGAGGPGSGEKLSQGLVGFWNMDESSGTRSDSSGNSQTLTDNNTVTSNPGKFGNAGQFTAANSESLSITDNANLSAGTTSFTMSSWIYLDGTANSMHIAGKGTGAGADGTTTEYRLYLSSSKIYFTVGDGSQKDVTASNFGNLTTGTWYFVTAWYDNANNRIGVQVNDSAANTTSVSSTGINDTAGTMYIGANKSAAAGSFWDGRIDSFRFYKRLLSPAEVRALYTWAPGPVGYWKMDEISGNANDSSGNGYALTNNNTATFNPGKYGKAAKLTSSSSQYFNVASNSNLQASGSFSITSWVYADTVSTNTYITSKYGGSTNEYLLRIDGGTKFGFTVYANPAVSAQSTITPSANTWYFVAGWYDAINKIAYISVNGGTPIASSAATDNPTVGTSAFRLGSLDGAGGYWNGKIDELKFYNYARTPGQIIEDMNGGHPIGGSPVGSQAAYWKFDEGYGDTAYNSISSLNNGDLAASGTTCPQAGDSACPTWTNAGKFGKALDFDNSATTDDYIDVGNIGITSYPFTMSGWIKNGTGSGAVIALTNSAVSTVEYVIGFSGGASPPPFMRARNTTPVDITDNNTNTNDGNWHHLMGVFASATDRKFYVDGKLAGIDTTSVTLSASATTWNIGRIGRATPAFYTDGIIDEVKVYAAELTQEQVLIDYNQGKSTVMGSVSTESNGTSPSFSSSREYCVPGDTSTCNAPVAEWKLDEATGTAANDTSGNANTGTLTNGPTWTPGKFGKAVSFDGSDDYISVADNTTTRLTTTATFSFWYKTTTLPTVNAGFIEKGNSGDVLDYYSLRANTSGAADFITGSNGTYSNTNPSATGYLSNDGNWHFYTISWQNNTANGLKYYRDGSLVTQATTPDVQIGTPLDGTLYLARSNAFSLNIPGNLDQVRIYNYARTPAQIAWEYNKGAPFAWYKFDECLGTTANDWAPNANGGFNGNNGTITIGATGTNTSAGTCTGSTGEAWKDGAIGKINASLEFDGTNDKVSLPSTTTVKNNAQVTFAGWIKPSSFDNSQIYFESTSGFTSRYGVDLSTSGNVRLHIRDSANDPSGTVFSVTSTSVVPLNTWTHVATVYDSINDVHRIYINGVLDKTDTTAKSALGSSTATEINIASGPLSFTNFTGQIDDVRIYNYALTPAQVKTVMNNGAVSFK